MYYKTTYLSPVGRITLACDSEGDSLAGLWIEGQKYHGGAIGDNMTEESSVPLFATVTNWLESYFGCERPNIADLPLAPVGSAFRQMVWEILCRIPYGEVITYGAIAKEMAAKTGKESMSGQAVGGAVGHNPISIIIPCHRVVASNGSLTGYAGGLETKIKLLKLEGADMENLFVPKKGTAL